MSRTKPDEMKQIEIHRGRNYISTIVTYRPFIFETQPEEPFGYRDVFVSEESSTFKRSKSTNDLIAALSEKERFLLLKRVQGILKDTEEKETCKPQ